MKHSVFVLILSDRRDILYSTYITLSYASTLLNAFCRFLLLLNWCCHLGLPQPTGKNCVISQMC